MRTVQHTWKTFKNVSWRLAWKYYKKKSWAYVDFSYSRLIGKTHWNVDVDGAKVKLYFSSPYQHGYAKMHSEGKHERTLLLMWKKYAEQSKSIVDAGSYDGIYGLVAATANPQAQVVMFEPDPINAKHIENNIKMSGLTNAVLVPKALAGKEGLISFEEHPGGSGGRIDKGGKVTVETTTLKKHMTTPDLIKLDIVGAEYDALMASKEMLLKVSDVKIFLELYPTNEKLLTFLEELGYTVVYLYPREDGVAKYYFVFKPPLSFRT